MASHALWAVFTVEIPHFAPRLWEAQCLRFIVKCKDVTETHPGAGLGLGTPEHREVPVLLRRVVRHLGDGGQTDAAASCCSAFASTFSLSCSFSSLFLSISKTLPTTPYLLPLKANAPPLGPFWLSPAWAVGSGLRFDVTSG